MKKTLEVRITRQIEIEISDDLLTEEAMQEFSEGMWKVYHHNQLFEYAAVCCAEGDSFVEGLGYAFTAYYSKPSAVKYLVLSEEAESEILEKK